MDINKLFAKHEAKYMDRVFDKYPRKYDVGGGILFRHQKGEIRCAALDPGSAVVEPDGVKEFSGGHEEWIYKLT